MKRKRRIQIFLFILFTLVVFAYLVNRSTGFISSFNVGQPVDSLNGVKVYYNGAVGRIGERNLSEDGYNIGLKYQCVEFVKRYYYEFYHHQMPDSYGNAKDFFNSSVKDGALNKSRGLIQYTNPSKFKPQVGDLIIFDGTFSNKFGHVAIISSVSSNNIEIIQQNPGINGCSRVSFDLDKDDYGFKIDEARALGWLRMKN